MRRLAGQAGLGGRVHIPSAAGPRARRAVGPYTQRRLPVVAALHGEDLLRFRTGEDLPAYCRDCAHSELTPVTSVLGCTKGDDPTVADYFRRLDAMETDPAAEKCPGFTSRDTGAAGDVAPETVVAGRSLDARFEAAYAGMVKEVPGGPPAPPAPGPVMAPMPHTEEEWLEVVDDQLAEIAPEHPELARVLDRAFEVLLLDRHRAAAPEQDYDYQGIADRRPGDGAERQGRRRTAANDSEPTWDDSERAAFFAYLEELGLGRTLPQSAAERIIVQALTTWRDGLLAGAVSDDLIKGLLADYKAGSR